MAQSQVSSWDWPPGVHDVVPMEIWGWGHAAPALPLRQATQHPPAGTEIGQVLTAWRAAERRLEGLLEASPMRTMVRSEVVRLRSEYHRLFALAKA